LDFLFDFEIEDERFERLHVEQRVLRNNQEHLRRYLSAISISISSPHLVSIGDGPRENDSKSEEREL
jgi:hypothetical protein